MFVRLVLAYVLALPLLVGMAARAAGPDARHSLVLTMSSTTPGIVQIFLDSGRGFSEAESITTPIATSVEPREYRLALPDGSYRHLRVDPGTAPGRYVLVRAVIVDGAGATEATIPLTALDPAYQLATVERTADRLVVDAPPGSTDPQLLYAPPEPLRVGRADSAVPRLAGTVMLIALAAFLLAWLLERAAMVASARWERPVASAWAVSQAHPRAMVLAVALVATLVATYPVLLLGRSFVSPNNGGKGMLYGVPPLAPFSADVEIEDTRESDTSAAMYAFVPYSNVQRQALRSGEWPLWNRYNAAGRPLWGQGQTFLLDPLHWFTLITPDPSLGWDLKFVAHRFVFAAGVGCAALAVTGGWLPAAIAAFGAPFAGDYAYRLNHPAAFTMTYVPWALLAWFQLAGTTDARARARAALLLAAATSLVLLAAPPKEAVIALVGTSAAGALALLLAPGSWRERGRRWLAAILAGTATVLLTAPHWLVFLDTLRRSATLYDTPYVEVGGIPNAVAFFLGPLAPGRVLPGLNALSLVLLAALVAAPRRLFERRALLACALVVAAFTAVAFGVIPPRWIVKLPFFGNIGHVFDVFLIPGWPMLLILGAAGASVLLAATRPRILATTLLAALATSWIVIHAAALSPANAFEPTLALLVLAAGVLLPGCLAAGRLARAAWLPAITSGATILVLVLPGGLHGGTGMPPLDALLVQPRLRVPLDANPPVVDTVHHAAREPGRAVGVDWVLFSGSQAMYEIEGLGGPDALKLANYDDLFRSAGVWVGWGWFTRVPVADVARLQPLLDMLNTEFLLARPDEIPPGFVDVPVAGVDRLKIGRRATAWPRAFFVDGVSTYTDSADLLRHVAAAGKPLAAIQRTDRAALDATRLVTAPSGAVIAATGYTLTVNSTRFHVAATGPGVAVLGESYLPDDFRVTLNGQPAGYFRVDHVFKGVAIPAAGNWDLVFEYQPAHWRLSLLLGGAGLLVVAGLGVRARRAPLATRTAPTSAEPPASRLVGPS